MAGFARNLRPTSSECARAVALGKDDPVVLAASGWALAFVVRDLSGGAALIDRSLTLNSNLAEAWSFGGWVKLWLGEHDAAIERFRRALRLSPLDLRLSAIQNGIAHGYFFLGRFDEAGSWAEIGLRGAPDSQPLLRVEAASNALGGQLGRAKKAAARLRQLNPELRISNLHETHGPYRRIEDISRYREGLHRAGLPE